MYKTGSRVKPGQFSRENAGENVLIYGTNSQRLTDRRWAQLMASYGVETDKKQKGSADSDLDEQQFRNLYIPSSP
jgi:hypothetical protein